VLRTIAELNQLSPEHFAEAVRPLFEAAAPLADALYKKRPFASYDELIQRGEACARGLPVAQQIEVINAHPRIGESAEQLSALSLREQGALEAPWVYATLAELNQTYEDRFGFRFLVFVHGRSKAQIVEILKQRLEHSRSAELRTALGDMFAIARDRLSSITRPPTER
jgi:OHCU decarboxylase